MPFAPLLPSPVLTWIVFLGAILILLGITEWISARLRVSTEVTRRTVHIIVGLLILLCRFIFQEPFWPLVTGVLFIGINLVTLRMEKFKSMHATERVSYGTVYFPLAFVILVALFWERSPLALEISILVLALADPLAAWVGRRWGRDPFILWQDPKTVAGAVAIWAGSFLLIGAGLACLSPFSGRPPIGPLQLLLTTVLAATVATIAEAQSRQGSDNLTVPLAVGLFIYFFLDLPADALAPFLLWTNGSGVVLALACRARALSISGFLTAWILGVFIFLGGGWIWVWPSVAFFVLSSILTRYNRRTAALSERVGLTTLSQANLGHRDLVQVMANGGIPLLVALAYGLWQVESLYLVYLAALAGATADTWATEIGSWSRKPPRDIITRRPIPQGTSGGVTWLGTTGSIVGAATLAAVGWGLQPHLLSPDRWLIITAIGFFAALFDSLLGATVQARYRDPASGEITEDTALRRMGGALHSGWSWLDNNMVNLLCTTSAALAGLGFLI